MLPILFRSGDFVLASWHVFFVLGAFAGWYGMQSIRSIVLPSLSEGQLDRLFVALYIAGYFGARIFSILFEDPFDSAGDLFRALISFGSMTLYGGIIAVVLVLCVFAQRKKISLLHFGALFAAPGLIAIGVGRVGCFLNGDDYGAPIPDQLQPSWWTVQFPNLGDSIYRYPVQVWEALFGIGLGLLLILLIKKFPEKSLWMADAGVLGYTAVRFFLENYRGDERGQFFGSALSTSQGISVVLAILWTIYRVTDARRTKISSGV
ncbi:MAG: prolipoprotein diacylglyceryl transferase [Oligoflexus sp.]|nr:prolipoprotein diacylglyceryl transferase [Oligoflexus sp.]